MVRKVFEAAQNISLLSKLPGIFLVVDREGLIIEALGHSLGDLVVRPLDLIGKNIAALEWFPMSISELKLVRNKPIYHTSKSGNHYIEISATFAEPLFVMQIQDITQKSHHDNQLDQQLYQQSVYTLELQKTQKEMLDNMNQAILTIDGRLCIHQGYSYALQTIFGREESMVGMHLIDDFLIDSNLGIETIRRVSFDLRSIFGSDELQWMCTSHALPTNIICDIAGIKKHLKLRFIPLYNYRKLISKIMIVIEDVSNIQRLESEASKKQHELQLISDIVEVDDRVYESFICETKSIFASCWEALERCSKDLKSAGLNQALGIFFRNVHTIKGSSGLFNLVDIQNKANEIEDYYAGAIANSNITEQEILEKLKNLLTLLEEEVNQHDLLRRRLFRSLNGAQFEKFSQPQVSWLVSLVNRCAQLVSRPLIQSREVDALLYECKAALDGVGKTPLRFYIDRFDALTSKLALRYKKSVQPLKVHSSINYFEGDFLAKISEIIVHCISNSVCHGIESPSEREARNKPNSGKISIRLLENLGTLRLIIEDDGRGIDPRRMCEISVLKGLLSLEESKKLSDADKINLVFRSGLSSQLDADIWTGRGVGMDAVKDMTESLGGHIRIESEVNHGTRIIMDIPYETQSLLHSHSLFDVIETMSRSLQAKVTNRIPVIVYQQRARFLRLFLDIQGLVVQEPEALKAITLQEISKSGSGTSDYQVTIEFDQMFLQKCTFEAAFYESLDKIRTMALDVGCTLTCSSDRLVLEISTNLSHDLKDLNIHLITNSNHLKRATRYIQEYLREYFKRLEIEVCHHSLEELEHDRSLLERGRAFSIILLDDSNFEDFDLLHSKGIMDSGILEGSNLSVIVFANNPDLILPERWNSFGANAILAKMPISKPQVEQVFELALLNYIRASVHLQSTNQKPIAA